MLTCRSGGCRLEEAVYIVRASRPESHLPSRQPVFWQGDCPTRKCAVGSVECGELQRDVARESQAQGLEGRLMPDWTARADASRAQSPGSSPERQAQ